MLTEPKQLYLVPCRKCDAMYGIEAYQSDMDKYQRGEGLIQDIFPYLSIDDREMLLSHICPECWSKMFKEE